jgi:hypothetical protein
MIGTPTATASTKRNPAATGGKIAEPAPYLESVTLAFAPLPASLRTMETYRLESPRKSFETGLMGTVDIREGDVLVYGGREYRVVAANPIALVDYTSLVLELVKGT